MMQSDSQALNFVPRSDGLSRARVCHVSIKLEALNFTPNRPNGRVGWADVARLKETEDLIWVF